MIQSNLSRKVYIAQVYNYYNVFKFMQIKKYILYVLQKKKNF